jgi:hypothetical protein
VHQVVQFWSLVERRGGTMALAGLDEQFATLL